MVFRLAVLYSFYVFPAWFIVREFSVAAIPALLGTYFSALIVLTVILIRIRRFVNSRTEKVVNGAPTSEKPLPISVSQSFTFRDYLGLNAEVMFSYLRPYLSIIGGFTFLVLLVTSVRFEYGIVKSGLAFALSLYLLTVPWIFFLVKTRSVYIRSRPYLENQSLSISSGEIIVRAGPSKERIITTLEDIAVTRNYLLLFVAGSNYLQILRDKLDSRQEAIVLGLAYNMVLAKAPAEA
jgi:hypothetical protein